MKTTVDYLRSPIRRFPARILAGLLTLLLTLADACAGCALVFLLAASTARAASPPVARSLEFNGQSSDIVYHAVQPWMNTNTVNLTVEAWIYPRELGYLQALVARAQSTNLWFGLSSNRLRFARSGGAHVESTGTVPLRRWTHVAATYNGSTARFYIDGLPAGAATLAHAGNNCTNVLSFGGQHDVVDFVDLFAGGYAFNGLIDEARLWSTVRSSGEIISAMDQEVRSASGLMAAYGDGGDLEELNSQVCINHSEAFLRRRGFGILPATLSIPWTGSGLVADGDINPLYEYDGAETVVLRSESSPLAWDMPAYLLVATNATNHDLFVGIPELPVGESGATPVVQIRGARQAGGSAFALGDWECRITEAGTKSGTSYRTNSFLPVPTWQLWPEGALNWSAATTPAAEFRQSYEFRIHAPNLNWFTNTARLLARYYNYDSSGDQLAAPSTGVAANPATYATANWGREVYAPRTGRFIQGSVSNITMGAGVSNLVVSMFSGDNEFTGFFLTSTRTDSNGVFRLYHPSVPVFVPVTVTYSPPGGGNITYLDPLPDTNGYPSDYAIIATNSPYSVRYPESGCTFGCGYKRVHFRMATGGPLGVTGVSSSNLEAKIVVRTSPRKTSTTNTITFTLFGSNFHSRVQVFLQGPRCSVFPPSMCADDFIEAAIRSIAPDGSSLEAEAPENLVNDWRVVVSDPFWVATGGQPWHFGPTLSLRPPIWAKLHGFEFENDDDHPSVEEFEACYGDSIFAGGVPGVRDPYYALWAAVYGVWMEEVRGSCFGMAGTARLLEEGSLSVGLFDTAEAGGVHGVRFANGFQGLASDPSLPPAPGRWTGPDLFQPTRPLNVWARITSLAAAQTSAEAIASTLSQLRPPVPFGAARGFAQGDPNAVLDAVRAHPGNFTLCIQRRDFGKGHCVTPHGVVDEFGLMADALTPTNAPGFSLIAIYDNNFADEQRYIEINRTMNTYRYNSFSFQVADPEADNYLGRGLFRTSMSIYRNARHAPGPDTLAEYGTDFLRLMAVGADGAGFTNTTGAAAGWSSSGITNGYAGALPYLPVGYLPGAAERFDTTMLFLPTSNAPTGGTFTSRGSNMLAYAALGWSDFAFGFVAPNTSAAYSLYGITISSNQASQAITISSNQALTGIGVRAGAAVQGFGAMVSARDAAGQCRVWTLDAGSDALTPDVHLSHEGFSLLRVRNNGAAPLTYRVNLAGVDNGAGLFEFSTEWITQPAGVTFSLRTLPANRGFQRELDADNDGVPENVDELPARGALRADKEGSLLALRWRQAANDETLESTDDLTNPNWTPVNTAVNNDGADRKATAPTSGPAQFFRVKPAGTNCHSLATLPLGPKPNPWETNGFKFEAFTAFGAMRPYNEIVTRSGATGLDVYHTVRIHPQDDCRVIHLDILQTSGHVICEAVNVLGAVASRVELTGPGTGIQRVTLRGFRERIHFVRVISPNALCLVANICCEREAQTVPQPQPQTCLGFENMTPDFLNSPATFGLMDVSTDMGPLAIEPVPGLGVNGLKVPIGFTLFQIAPSFGSVRRITVRVYDPVGDANFQGSSTFVIDLKQSIASPTPQTIELNGSGMTNLSIPTGHEFYLLEICVERDPLPGFP